MRAAQKPGINRPRQIQIVGKNRLAGAFRHRVDLAQRLADDGEIFLFHDVSF
jgi:hypothetical protein